MTVDDDGFPAERASSLGIRLQIPLQFGRTALAESIHVEDRGEVAQPLVAGTIERLPDRAFGALAVADEDPHVVRRVEQRGSREREARPDRQALPRRAGRDIDPGKDRGRVTFQATAELR